MNLYQYTPQDPRRPHLAHLPSALPAPWERKIAARWEEWRGWVGIYLRDRGYSPVGSPQLESLRRQHSENVAALLQKGITIRLIRRHRLDDPRIGEGLRAVLVHAVMERRRKANRACAPMADSSWRLRPVPACPSQMPRNAVASLGGPVTIDLVRKSISAYFHLRELQDQELTVRCNRPIITFPRQLAMYLVRQLTTASLPEIARHFGGKHHATVLHSVNKIDRLRRSDQELNRTITRLMDALQQQ